MGLPRSLAVRVTAMTAAGQFVCPGHGRTAVLAVTSASWHFRAARAVLDRLATRLQPGLFISLGRFPPQRLTSLGNRDENLQHDDKAEKDGCDQDDSAKDVNQTGTSDTPTGRARILFHAALRALTPQSRPSPNGLGLLRAVITHPFRLRTQNRPPVETRQRHPTSARRHSHPSAGGAAGEHRFRERSQLVSQDNRGDGFAGASGRKPSSLIGSRPVLLRRGLTTIRRS
jgi:hypothetical protein